MSSKLRNYKLGYSPLSDTIYLYRHGKDPQLSLDKKIIMGAKTTFTSNGKNYELTLKLMPSEATNGHRGT